jgi:hypothetical protein
MALAKEPLFVSLTREHCCSTEQILEEASFPQLQPGEIKILIAEGAEGAAVLHRNHIAVREMRGRRSGRRRKRKRRRRRRRRPVRQVLHSNGMALGILESLVPCKVLPELPHGALGPLRG